MFYKIDFYGQMEKNLRIKEYIVKMAEIELYLYNSVWGNWILTEIQESSSGSRRFVIWYWVFAILGLAIFDFFFNISENKSAFDGNRYLLQQNKTLSPHWRLTICKHVAGS